VVVINGERLTTHEVAPPYLAYRLLDGAAMEVRAQSLVPVLRWAGVPAELDSLLIGTDGLLDVDDGSLSGLIGDPAYLLNATLLHKKLAALSERTKKLFDDTTVVLIRRRAAGAIEAGPR
jgi:hypothetical protein